MPGSSRPASNRGAEALVTADNAFRRVRELAVLDSARSVAELLG